MKLTQEDPSKFYDAAFCLSSVRLWCDVGSDSIREVAGSVEQRGQIVAEFLCVARTRGDETRVWFPYIAATSDNPAALTLLMEWTRERLNLSSIQATAFAEVETPAVRLLLHSGWLIERVFPVELHWPNLDALVTDAGSLPEEIRIDFDPSLDEVSELFADAFLGEWEWYFEEMGYCPQSSTREHLHELTKRYVSGADAYFIVRITGQPVALSSLVLRQQWKRAEFHTGVGVMPNARGRGLGRLITEFTLNYAKRKGMTRAEVRTQERAGTRNPNVEMYQACGGRLGRKFCLFRLCLVR
jgi:GNAT superfamily N-acetyltransferase